jgi:hypothetical protein
MGRRFFFMLPYRASVSDLQHSLGCTLMAPVHSSLWQDHRFLTIMTQAHTLRRFCLAGAPYRRQTRTMKRPPGEQELLFGPATSTRPARRRQPPKQIAVSVSAEAIKAAKAGRIDGERIIAAAVRTVRPDVRNIAVDLGTIRWTDPKTNRRVTFGTPIVVRDALLALAGGAVPGPFRFILGRETRAARSIRPAGPPTPD